MVYHVDTTLFMTRVMIFNDPACSCTAETDCRIAVVIFNKDRMSYTTSY